MVSEGSEFEPATSGPTSASTYVKQLEIVCRNFASLNAVGIGMYNGEGNTIRAFWTRLRLQASFLAFHPSFGMIDDTSGYTERRLSNIIESLRALSLSELLPQACVDNKYTIDESERLKRCLETCVRISKSINDRKRAGDHTAASLAGYHEKLTATISELKEFLKAIDRQNVAARPSDQTQRVQIDEPILRSPGQIQKQDWRSEDVNMNRFEDIFVAEDGIQIISSTTGDLIQAKNISAGVGSVQCVGSYQVLPFDGYSELPAGQNDELSLYPRP